MLHFDTIDGAFIFGVQPFRRDFVLFSRHVTYTQLAFFQHKLCYVIIFTSIKNSTFDVLMVRVLAHVPTDDCVWYAHCSQVYGEVFLVSTVCVQFVLHILHLIHGFMQNPGKPIWESPLELFLAYIYQSYLLVVFM